MPSYSKQVYFQPGQPAVLNPSGTIVTPSTPDHWEYKIYQDDSAVVFQDYDPDQPGQCVMDESAANAHADAILERFTARDVAEQEKAAIIASADPVQIQALFAQFLTEKGYV